MTPQDSSELHDKPLVVKVAVKAADGQYSASNEIKGYQVPKQTALHSGPCGGSSGGGSATLEAIICFAMGRLLLPHFTNREEPR